MKCWIEYKGFLLLMLMFVIGNQQLFAQQQIENSMSQYYRNKILMNPGFTGIDGNKGYALQNRSWVGFDGAPVLTAFTGEFNFGQNSSAGVQVISDVTGILYRTFGVFSYAYRIKFQEEKQLRIGISLSIAGDRLDSRFIDPSVAIDPLIANNINQKAYYDGNLGLVYTAKNLTLSGSFFRIGEVLNGKIQGDANLAYFKGAAFYDINGGTESKLQVKPMAMIRLFKATETVADLGLQFEYNQLVHAMLIYQTTGNIRTGAGLKIQQWGEANFFYNSNQKIANVNSQQYELGLGVFFGKKQR